MKITDSAARSAAILRVPTAVVAALLYFLGVPSAATAQRSRSVEVENMRVGFDASVSSLKSSNSFKIGAWTPIWVQLGGAERFSGFMDVIVADDDGTPTTFRMPVDVPANQGPGSRLTDVPVHGSPSSRYGCLTRMDAGSGRVARHGHAAGS